MNENGNEILRSIDQYEILRELGRGGTSVVYLVTDRADGRSYAMKVLRRDGGNKSKEFVQEADSITRHAEADFMQAKAEVLRAEASVLQALCSNEESTADSHPGIPAFIECICDENGEFVGFVMEYVEGRSLQQIMEDGRSYTVREAAEAGLQLCSILERLHGQKPPIIFRDLKPANILVRPGGEFVLVDYGAVRKLRKNAGTDTMQLGTDGYAAPEQYGGWEQSDERTDIYGIGAVLHHMVTGRPPLETGLRPLGEVMGAKAENWQYAEMGKVLLRCCMTAPSMRYSSCAEMEKALQGVIRGCERYRNAGNKFLKKAASRKMMPADREKNWNRFVLLANTAAVCLLLTLALAASAAGAETVEYCSFLEKAQKETALEDKKVNYLKAAALRPEDPEAYTCFLRELAEDCVITEEEKRALDDVLFGGGDSGRRSKGLWETAAGSAEGNLERMRRKRPGDYAALQMELGRVYFGCYEGGSEAAKQCFRNALAEAGIWFEGREMAEAMEVVLGDEWGGVRIGAWRVLEEAAVREAEESGDGVFAASVCKAAAVEIALSADRYEEAGADPEALKEVVQIAESLLDEVESGRIRVPDRLREELRAAAESAGRIVNGSAR